MEDKSIEELLKSSAVFSSLDENKIRDLASKIEIIELNENEILFYQGDPSENVYLLSAGKLAAELVNSLGESKIVGRILPGEMVGELGAITSESRTLTIKALTPSTLLKLASKEFLAAVHDTPAILTNIISPLISRSTDLLKLITMDKNEHNIVIVPANSHLSLETFVKQLKKVGEKFPSTLVISNYQSEFQDKHTSLDDVKNKVKDLVKETKRVHRICYILSSAETYLARFAFQKQAKIYVVANAGDEPKIDHHVLNKIENEDHQKVHRANLILLHEKHATEPKNTLNWLQLAKFNLYHHVRLGKSKDFQRLFRFIRGKAVGVVLSGGGTRGWAHIGAIKAIRESKIPIDIIGGTSVGALVAGLYAMHQSFEGMYKSFCQMVIDSENSISWRSLTWPIASLFNAKKFTNSQINTFDQRLIENLWLPFFAVSSNLSTNSEDIHQRGLLWEVIRASTSISGLIPPMILNGELHIDGGLLNNLPVDVMRRFIGQQGKVITIQLNNFMPDNIKYNFSPIVTFTDYLLDKLKFGKRKNKYPPFLDTFLHGIFLSSLLRENTNALISNIFVSLNLREFKMLHSSLEEGEKLVQIGYDETMKKIDHGKKKNISLV